MDDRLSAAHPGERWVLRRRLPDGSATDVVGWLEAVTPEDVMVSVPGSLGVTVPDLSIPYLTIPYEEVITARRAPAALGGPGPARTSPAALEQIALPAWLAEHEALGAWTLRSGGGFTGRANSCLAVGDPGMSITAAADRVVAYADRHGIEPWAQVVTGSAEDEALTALGWRPVYVETVVLASRLTDLLGRTLPDPRVRISDDVADVWDAYARSRPTDADPRLVRMIIDGTPPRAFATTTVDGAVEAIGRGHLHAGWLGIAAVWTAPEHRRHGYATMIMIALGHWAARRGARWGYLQVATENAAAIAAYGRLGFAPHHRYRYLTPG